MPNAAYKAKLAKLALLRSAADDELLTGLRKALSDRSNYIIAKGAAIAAERYAIAVVPELLAAFDRLCATTQAVDPLALGKTAIAKALKDLDYREPAVYLRGFHHVQLEAAWGPPVDAAAGLRGTCALALVNCEIDDATLLREFVDRFFTDAEKGVRGDIARAIGEIGGQQSVLLLRAKALSGDADAEVLGECFLSLLGREPRESLTFVERFLVDRNPDVRFEAICALAGSRESAAQAVVARFWATELPSDVRRAIIFSRAASAATEAADFLLSIVSDPRRGLAVWALAALGTSRFRAEIAERVRCAVVQTGDPALLAAYSAAFAPDR